MFALIGDIPYDAEQEAKFFNLIQEMNQAQPAFVVHDGDMKKGSPPCSDEVFRQRYELFQAFESPFVFIFGDNEWTDCYHVLEGERRSRGEKMLLNSFRHVKIVLVRTIAES